MVGGKGSSWKNCDLKCENRNSPTSNRFEFIGYRVRPSGIPLSVRGPAQAAGREYFLFGFRKRYTKTLHVPRTRSTHYVHAVLEFDSGQQQFVGPRPTCRILQKRFKNVFHFINPDINFNYYYIIHCK